MNIPLWLPALAGAALVLYLLVQRFSPARDESAERLAFLVGARRAWGESDASLRKRSIALSRSPHAQQAPELAWWARLWGRIWPRRGA